MIKVVWLCHFANKEMKDYFQTPHIMEMAPWINNLIEMFKVRNEIELHVVAPNVFTNQDCSFVKENIYYHFFSIRHKFIPKKVNTLIKILFGTNYSHIKYKIKSIIYNINPQLIHLHGAENPYYSAGILYLIGEIPTLTTIQGFIRNTDSLNKESRKRIAVEKEIIQRCNNFGVRTKEMSEIVHSLNPKAKLFFHNYPLTIPKYITTNESTFDIIFFARVCKDKGIEDLLKALIQVKIEKPQISLHIIGPVRKSYKDYLNNIIKSYGLESNVVWVGFLENQQEIFKYAVNARICVLPTYHDIIPGTIIESMYMKLPVVAYAVGGIPELNEEEETVLLVEKKNIPFLANSIVKLLNNENGRRTMAEKAYCYALKKFNNSNVVADLVKAYEQIIN